MDSLKPDTAAADTPRAAEGRPPGDDSTVSLQVVEVVQTVLTGVILAFIFRAFFIEAFVIPTGSMAEALRGRHSAQVCDNCGVEFAYGPAYPSADEGPFVAPEFVMCPNCHVGLDSTPTRDLARAGDRVLVKKWTYALGGWLDPARWDVVVFRDPADPQQNYIKRLVALPGEAVEIIDGDVYVRGPGPEARLEIPAKTPAAQRSLWLPVFAQAFFPRLDDDRTHAVRWRPRTPAAEQAWTGLTQRTLRFHPPQPDPAADCELEFDNGPTGLYGRDVYGYDVGDGTAYVGDARLSTGVAFLGQAGTVEVTLVRDGLLWLASLDRAGRVTLSRRPAGGPHELLGQAPLPAAAVRSFELAHLDGRVRVAVDGRVVIETTPDQYTLTADDRRGFERLEPLTWRLGGSGGAFELHGLRLERDVHYAATYKAQRAVGDAFELRAGEYFVLGDNSPTSHDSREWFRASANLREAGYRLGTVREDQIVGRAFFVYLPGLVPLDERGRFWFPDLGRVRWVR